MLSRIDPLVRLLVAATVLALLLPVRGEARAVAQVVSNAAVFLLFLLNGLRLPRHEVVAGMGNHRLLWPLIGWVFGIMPALGWMLWRGGQGTIEPLIALGFLYLGCLPSTVQSATAYCSLAGGNVASSVVAAALLNILGVFVSAPLFSLLGGAGGGAFDAGALVKVVGILLVPFVIGQIMQDRFGDTVRAHRALATLMDRTTIAISVYVAFSGAVIQRFWTRIEPEGWIALALGTAAMLLVAHLGAWLLGGALRLVRGDRIAFLFAGAQKSVAMGAPLAAVLFAPDRAGVILLPLLIYHLAQLVLAAPLAGRLNRR